MPNRFASGKNAIAECDRCGFRYKLKQLKSLVIKTKNVNILVCPECWEKDQPQLSLGLYPVDDPQAIRNPRPDLSYYEPGNNGAGGSRVIQWGWNPVGGAPSWEATPNDLVAYGQVGTVVITDVVGPDVCVNPLDVSGYFVMGSVTVDSGPNYPVQVTLSGISTESAPIDPDLYTALSWTSGGPNATSYEIYRDLNGTGRTLLTTVSSGTLSYSDGPTKMPVADAVYALDMSDFPYSDTVFNPITGAWSPTLSQYIACSFTIFGTSSVFLSSDALHWANVTGISGPGIILITETNWFNYNGGIFLLTSNQSSYTFCLAYSATGQLGSWTRPTMPIQNILSAAYSASTGVFCVVGTQATDYVCATSTDLSTWTRQTGLSYAQWNRVRWIEEEGLFVAVSRARTSPSTTIPGGKIATSPDGVTWTVRVDSAQYGFSQVVWSSDLGIAVAVARDNILASADSHDVFFTSTDLVNWTLQETNWAAPTAIVGLLTWSPERQIFGGLVRYDTSGSCRFVWSSDGITWYMSSDIMLDPLPENTYKGQFTIWDSNINKFVSVGKGISFTTPDYADYDVVATGVDGDAPPSNVISLTIK